MHDITPFSFLPFLDVNECGLDSLSENQTTYVNNCHDDANCTNTKGSFYCTCLNGYSGDGVSCVGKPASLKNLTFRFAFATTLFPFILRLDVNECEPGGINDVYRHLAHNCHNDSICTNIKGSFYCTCLSGYTGDGVFCTGKF